MRVNPIEKHISKISAISSIPFAWAGSSKAGAVLSGSTVRVRAQPAAPAPGPGHTSCLSEGWLPAGLGICTHFFHLWEQVRVPGLFLKKGDSSQKINCCRAPASPETGQKTTQHYCLMATAAWATKSLLGWPGPALWCWVPKPTWDCVEGVGGQLVQAPAAPGHPGHVSACPCHPTAPSGSTEQQSGLHRAACPGPKPLPGRGRPRGCWWLWGAFTWQQREAQAGEEGGCPHPGGWGSQQHPRGSVPHPWVLLLPPVGPGQGQVGAVG